ncbi:hypothetical protein ACFL0Y_01190 [Patescibacteria group bacterium]
MPTKTKLEKFKEFVYDNGKPLALMLAVSLILLLVMVVGFIFQKLRSPEIFTPTAAPTPTPTIFLAPPLSTYGKDPDILKSEEELDKIDILLNTIDLYETSLLPPTLDMKVEIKEL